MAEGISGSGGQNRTVVERKGDREIVVTRSFDAPPSTVFQAWSRPELFQRWWMPRSLGGVSIVGCELDMRTGGKYRLAFGADGAEGEAMVFYGKYIEVVPNERIVWTNDEGEEGAITTVTFAAQDGRTLLTFHEIYPTAAARDEAMQGSAAGLPEQLDQLEELVAGLEA